MERRDFLKIAGLSSMGLFIPSKTFSLENIIGNVKDVLSENPVEGANIKLYNYPSGEFIREYISNSNGDYYLSTTKVNSTPWRDVKLLFRDVLAKKINKPSSSDIVRAEIIHQDYHNATRYFDSKGNNFDTSIIPASFDMDIFDSWARTKGKGLQKWVNQPEWDINVAGAERGYIDLVKEIISNDISQAMKWNNPIVREVETNENIGKIGKYVVYWTDEDNDNYGNHEEILDGNEIISASTWFLKSNKTKRIFLRQLTQGLGFVRNTSDREFYTSDGNYNQNGLDMLTVLCSMKKGTISPDTEPILL
jgi:hypothetical protein